MYNGPSYADTQYTNALPFYSAVPLNRAATFRARAVWEIHFPSPSLLDNSAACGTMRRAARRLSAGNSNQLPARGKRPQRKRGRRGRRENSESCAHPPETRAQPRVRRFQNPINQVRVGDGGSWKPAGARPMYGGCVVRGGATPRGLLLGKGRRTAIPRRRARRHPRPPPHPVPRRAIRATHYT